MPLDLSNRSDHQCANQGIDQNFMQKTECDRKMPASQCRGEVKSETGDKQLVAYDH